MRSWQISWPAPPASTSFSRASVLEPPHRTAGRQVESRNAQAPAGHSGISKPPDDRSPGHRQRRTFGKRPGSMMALNLRTLVANLPYDHVVVLTGRRHARRTPRSASDQDPWRRRELLLVRISFRGGSSWHCPRRGACGIYDLPAVRDGRPLNRVPIAAEPAESAGLRRRNRAGVSHCIATGVPASVHTFATREARFTAGAGRDDRLASASPPATGSGSEPVA